MKGNKWDEIEKAYKKFINFKYIFLIFFYFFFLSTFYSHFLSSIFSRSKYNLKKHKNYLKNFLILGKLITVINEY